MAKYVCTICAYIYDEAEGIPESGIAPGTLWEDLPEGWVCPLCGATKDAFDKEGETSESVEEKPRKIIEVDPDMKEMTPLEISALCTNLARGCEKQYKAEESELFTRLADYFKQGSAPAEDPNFEELLDLVNEDLESGFLYANEVATNAKDRGALRALTWSIKVTKILKSLLARYEKEGEAMLENTNVYVCTICGFISISDTPPELCPVCKVQDWKFEKVEGGIAND